MTQEAALQIMKTGTNVFLTGEPGSGKTHTVNRYVAYLRSHDIEPAITASTGIAATHLNGMTIHSWSGIGVKPVLTNYDLDQLAQNERVTRRVKRTKVLIIDEISMLSAQTLGMVDQVCRELRHSHEPFGGMQVVLVGDFFQLPPVFKQDQNVKHQVFNSRLDFANNEDLRSQFAYCAPAWRALKPLVCYLSEQHRQEDREFLATLSALRRGAIDDSHRAQLNQRLIKENKIPRNITKLFPHNVNVDRINDAELETLSGTRQIFTMKSKGAPPLVEALKRNCLSPETLILKLGAKVMFTKNNPEGKFVNGTMGEVTSFRRTDNYPVIKTSGGYQIVAEPAEWLIEIDGKPKATISQFPLRLAWAITVHKSQGLSLDAAVIDLSQAFEYGQGYVALSRVRTLAGLHLLGWNERALQVHPDIRAQDKQFREQSIQTKTTFQTLDPTRLAMMHQNFIRANAGVVFATTTPKSGRTRRRSRFIV
jgi:ATP-dependent exoDNAse (exonuclease V) alpha subunit